MDQKALTRGHTSHLTTFPSCDRDSVTLALTFELDLQSVQMS